jgi:hypothetical protein
MTVLLREHGQSWRYGNLEFSALVQIPQVATPIIPDRGLAFGEEHIIEVTAASAVFGETLPRPGESLLCGSTYYPIAATRHSPGGSAVTFSVRQPA